MRVARYHTHHHIHIAVAPLTLNNIWNGIHISRLRLRSEIRNERDSVPIFAQRGCLHALMELDRRPRRHGLILGLIKHRSRRNGGPRPQPAVAHHTNEKKLQLAGCGHGDREMARDDAWHCGAHTPGAAQRVPRGEGALPRAERLVSITTHLSGNPGRE